MFSRLLQQSEAIAPYLGRRVSPHRRPSCLQHGIAPLGPPAPTLPQLLGQLIIIYPISFSAVAQSRSTLCDPMDCGMAGIPVPHQLPKFTQTRVHWVSDTIQPSHPLSSPLCPPSVFPTIRVFCNESVLRIRWPKYWSFSFSISPSNKYSGLISFRMDWLDLLVVQGTLKSLLQHHSSKHQFFSTQLSLYSISHIRT